MNSLFKALNDETRRQIIELLKDKNLNAGEIADEFKISKPSISHHLDILKRADLIMSEKKGQFIEYSLNTSILEDLLSWIITLKKTKNETIINKRTIFNSSGIITPYLLGIFMG